MSMTSGTSANVTLLDIASGSDDSVAPVDTTATKVIHATGWTMTRDVVESTYATNQTNGNRRRVAGTKDAKGTISGVYDPASPIEAQISPGARLQLQLHITDILGHQIKARILSGPDYNGDIEEGTVAKWVCSWAQDDNLPLFNTALVDATP